MKALIVDDEAHVIKAVRLLVPWESLGITQLFEASRPQESIRLMDEWQPEILITDIVMQDLSGIDLMSYINHSALRSKVVVISGYDNFEYVRGSLQNGGVDYLLKPLDQEQLIAAVKKAVDAWNQETALLSTVQSHREQIDSMTSLCRENLLSRMLAGEPEGQPYRELLQLCPELGNQTAFGFAYCNLEPFLPQAPEEHAEEISRFSAALAEFFAKNNSGFLLPAASTGEIRIFLSRVDTDLTEALTALLTSLDGKFSFPTTMGFASSGAFPKKLSETLYGARTAYGAIDALTMTPLLCRDALSPADLASSPSAEADGRMLLSALLTGNEALVDQSAALWLEHRLGSPSPSLSAVFRVIEEEHALFSGWVELFSRRHEGFFHQNSYRLLRFPDISTPHMRLSMERFLQRIHMDIFFLYQELKNLRSPEADMIYQVAHYLELNYSQPFSQFACAQMFFVNKEYLCRKFKQTFGVSMVTYLNNLRITQARYLLADPGIRIRQIAHDVGFEDEKYFSRQFKKVTGMTPAEYRVLALSEAAVHLPEGKPGTEWDPVRILK